MQASKVPIHGTALWLVVQGSRGGTAEIKGDAVEISPLVGLTVWSDHQDEPIFGGDLSPENAHIISEEIRKHAEFASAEQGE